MTNNGLKIDQNWNKYRTKMYQKWVSLDKRWTKKKQKPWKITKIWQERKQFEIIKSSVPRLIFGTEKFWPFHQVEGPQPASRPSVSG